MPRIIEMQVAWVAALGRDGKKGYDENNEQGSNPRTVIVFLLLAVMLNSSLRAHSAACNDTTHLTRGGRMLFTGGWTEPP